MKKLEPILVYNRETGGLEPEIVMGEGAVRFFYQNAVGRLFERILLQHRFVSKVFGFFQSRSFSRKKIERVAAELQIDLGEVERPVDGYRTFNDFFTRRLKPQARPIDRDPDTVIAACDSRLFVVPRLSDDTIFTVKGSTVSVPELLRDRTLAERYRGGTLFLYRLCPADYHRFHFPETSTPEMYTRIKGPLHSVNPMALATGWRILDRNLRHRTLLHAGGRAGTICMVEIGAMCVGSVVQTYQAGQEAQRGEEKGLFRFGGSSVVVLYQEGRVVVDQDIAGQSVLGNETLVKVGRRVGRYSPAGRA